MELIQQFIDFILHIDKHLFDIVQEYDKLTYLILAMIIFCETGLVVTPFLPGDSLLFAAGALAGAGLLNLALLIVILFCAAIVGDNLNFFIGNFIGHKIVDSKSKLIRRDYLDKTHEFYEKHGGKTVIIARFVPIVRTFAPFVAGLGSMTYRKFILFCILGNLIWILTFTLAGYALGNNPWVKEHFTLVTLGIIGVSLVPVILGIIKARIQKKSNYKQQ
jgi:membrane-associated protein